MSSLSYIEVGSIEKKPEQEGLKRIDPLLKAKNTKIIQALSVLGISEELYDDWWVYKGRDPDIIEAAELREKTICIET